MNSHDLQDGIMFCVRSTFLEQVFLPYVELTMGTEVELAMSMAHVSYVQTESIAIGNIASSHVYVTNFKFYNLGA